eukprot:TRINITY_DN56439_c0_g1_i1.p1 TRINITY_DN56439_c0_g1~~TRINITY_DN56439_c0_g1_i1.p1  ORF type:complete len:341 (+),score=61.86 TRINITY_DN56439_c0_g1_i1:92-1114(+)
MAAVAEEPTTVRIEDDNTEEIHDLTQFDKDSYSSEASYGGKDKAASDDSDVFEYGNDLLHIANMHDDSSSEHSSEIHDTVGEAPWEPPAPAFHEAVDAARPKKTAGYTRHTIAIGATPPRRVSFHSGDTRVETKVDATSASKRKEKKTGEDGDGDGESDGEDNDEEDPAPVVTRVRTWQAGMRTSKIYTSSSAELLALHERMKQRRSLLFPLFTAAKEAVTQAINMKGSLARVHNETHRNSMRTSGWVAYLNSKEDGMGRVFTKSQELIEGGNDPEDVEWAVKEVQQVLAGHFWKCEENLEPAKFQFRTEFGHFERAPDLDRLLDALSVRIESAAAKREG